MNTVSEHPLHFYIVIIIKKFQYVVLCCNNIDQSPFPDMCGRSNMFRIGYFWNCITYCNRALSCYLHCTKYTCHGCSSLFHFLAQTLSSMHQMELLQKRVNLYILCRCFFSFYTLQDCFLSLPQPLNILEYAVQNREVLPTGMSQRRAGKNNSKCQTCMQSNTLSAKPKHRRHG